MNMSGMNVLFAVGCWCIVDELQLLKPVQEFPELEPEGFKKQEDL